ncbi:MAG: DUF6265 family protein [Candidatus Acidiferrales bacterium]
MTRSCVTRSALVVCLASLAFAALPGSARAQGANGAGTASAPPQAPASSPAPSPAPLPKATLADFAWLAGRWQGVWGRRIAQQVWMPPKSGTMVGTFQLAENGQTLVIELFTLVEKPDGISFYFRHFTPVLAPWEKSDPTVLKLASADSKAIVFENPLDGQPKRAVIRRIDADTYVSRSEIVPDKGDMEIVEITYHRQKEVTPSRH